MKKFTGKIFLPLSNGDNPVLEITSTDYNELERILAYINTRSYGAIGTMRITEIKGSKENVS